MISLNTSVNADTTSSVLSEYISEPILYIASFSVIPDSLYKSSCSKRSSSPHILFISLVIGLNFSCIALFSKLLISAPLVYFSSPISIPLI